MTCAIGVDLGREVEIHDHHVEPGDIYMLGSDGLSDMLDMEEIGSRMTIH